ncbi:MAG TPA: FAD-dependent oxidoreductase [Vicinamibacteria bacterium]
MRRARRQDRRTFLGTLGVSTLALRGVAAAAGGQGVSAAGGKSWDAIVVGAGVFGAWTAWQLRAAGRSVLLVDQYGPANARASSGGESRVIRMSYGPDETYTRFSWRSLAKWKAFFGEVGRPELFQRTGVLWMTKGEDANAAASLRALEASQIPHERLDERELRKRYPQIAVIDGGSAILEPESGALMARRAVQAVVADAIRRGVEYQVAAVEPPTGEGRLEALRTASGEALRAGAFVLACGPWLAKVAPRALAGRIFPTRQPVFFFGVPKGDTRFSAPALPTWLDFGQGFYGMPDIEGRGLKVANDQHGPEFDPDTGERVAGATALTEARAFLEERFPGMRGAPLAEARVCQYENTSNGDFVIDRHPGYENVWLCGGGSGHGFKHGPAVGEYTAERVLKGDATDPRFTLASKQTVQKRSVH